MKNYRITRFACYGGYISQAVVNNFLPLLYVMFYTVYGIPLTRLAVVGVVNFIVQLTVDLLSAKIVDKLGYRFCAIGAHAFVAVGLILLAFLPRCIDPFAGITVAAVVYAVGGGLDEVIVSPIVESCPAPNKKGQMGLLHSMYCFGAAAVVAGASLFFAFCGMENWWILSLILTVIPLATLALFIRCPLDVHSVVGNAGDRKNLFRSASFYLFIVLILCAGASELAVAQWVSTYAELVLHIDKSMGDIFGACAFALVMGITRLVYSRFADRVKTEYFLLAGGIVTVISYLLASLVPVPIVNLVGCMLAGVGVGALWPAVFSMASARLPDGGTPLFSFLALGGDIGCALGAYVVGSLTGFLSLRQSLLCMTVFPVLLLVVAGYMLCRSGGKPPRGS